MLNAEPIIRYEIAYCEQSGRCYLTPVNGDAAHVWTPAECESDARLWAQDNGYALLKVEDDLTRYV